MDPHLKNQILLYQGSPSIWLLIRDLLNVIICTVSIIVCIIAIDIFIKFKNLRTDSNTYLFHYFICSSIKLLLGPILYFSFFSSFEPNVSTCLNVKISFSPTIVEVSFAGVLTIDWFLVNGKSRLVKKYGQFQNCLLISCYLNIVIVMALSITECLTYQNFYSGQLNINNFFVTLLMVIVINIFVNCKMVQDGVGSKYPLIIASSMLVLWLPNMIYEYYADVRDSFIETQNGYGQFVAVSVPITQMLSYFVPVCVFCTLHKMNESFQVASKGLCQKPGKRESLAMTDEPDNEPDLPISLVNGNEQTVIST